jgi:hypothetical protein
MEYVYIYIYIYIYIADCEYCRIIGEKKLKNMEGKLPTPSLVQLVWSPLRRRESAVAHLNLWKQCEYRDIKPMQLHDPHKNKTNGQLGMNLDNKYQLRLQYFAGGEAFV